MIISGLRDKNKEISNDVMNQKWMLAGVYEEQTGVFYFRDQEHQIVMNHFKTMHTNRVS